MTTFNPPRILGQRPLIKEFETYWSKERIASSADLPLFDGNGSKTMAILPENIRFMDLAPFLGVKTRVTIEVIP